MRTLFGLSLIVVFAVVLVGCSSSEPQTAGSAVPTDVEQVVDDYTDAIVAKDADAWRETITDEVFNRRYIFKTEPQELSPAASVEEDAPNEYATRIEFRGALEYEHVGDLFVVGDGP